jgi:hypothetical protein
MSPATEQILQAAMALPETERWELVSALLAEDPPAEWASPDLAYFAEIRRRSAEIDAGSVESSPWSVVRERAWRRVEGRSRD